MVPQLAGLVLDGKYRLTRPLGEGGMGFVYAAEHVALGRPLAVKFLRPELAQDATALARLRQEAIASSRIGSPHIVEVLDLGTAPGGMPFIVMEFLRGRTLAALLEAHPILPLARIARILSQALAGLAAAHAQGIVHRDLKPENVFLVESGSTEFVKLLDFGVSKVRGGLTTSNLTQTGAVLGTPRYMAPEQAAGRRDIDHRVDLWAAGVILYRALTGRFPFDADNYNALLAAILMQSPAPPRAFRPDLPPPLEAVVLTALAREPARRFASAEQFREALQPWLDAPDGGRHAGPVAGAALATYTPAAWPSAATTAGAAASSGVATGLFGGDTGRRPAGGTGNRTALPTDAPATTAAAPPRGRTGLWIALGLLLAAAVGSAAAWLAFARPWETEAPAGAPTPATRTASRAHASPFARHDPVSVVPVDAGAGATTTSLDAAGSRPDDAAGPAPGDGTGPVPPDAVGPATGEVFAGTLPAVPGLDGDLGEAYTPLLGGLEAMLQDQVAMGEIDLASLTPEQQRERRAVIEIAAELECMASEVQAATEGNNFAAATQLSLGMFGRIQAVCRRHGYTWFQYVRLAAKWSPSEGFTDEVEKLVEACAAARGGASPPQAPVRPHRSPRE